MTTKKLTISELRSLINEVKQEVLNEGAFSKNPFGPYSGNPTSQADHIRQLENELEELYNDPIENEDLIHDIEVDLEVLYADAEAAREDGDRTDIAYERGRLYDDY